MHVLLDVHVANNDQHVECSIASSHEDIHEVTSSSSCADLNSQSVVPSTGSQGMDLCLEFRSTNKVHSHQEIPLTILDYWVTPPILNMDRSITTFGSIWASIMKFCRNFPSITIFWWISSSIRPSDHLSKISPRGRWEMSNSQPTH